jgi:hypothetical protein
MTSLSKTISVTMACQLKKVIYSLQVLNEPIPIEEFCLGAN